MSIASFCILRTSVICYVPVSNGVNLDIPCLYIAFPCNDGSSLIHFLEELVVMQYLSKCMGEIFTTGTNSTRLYRLSCQKRSQQRKEKVEHR
jgi:hypothetical protein